MFMPLMECRKETRTWRQWIKLLWQKAYLWRLGRRSEYVWLLGGVVTKRALAKALRKRRAEMSKVEGYHRNPRLSSGCREKLIKRNKRERLMIHSILTDMYNVRITPDYLGTPNE